MAFGFHVADHGLDMLLSSKSRITKRVSIPGRPLSL
jgi:hypothetical protein